MKYNRTLDWAALSLQALTQGKPQLAARLLAKAAAEPDLKDALRIIEASNSQAAIKAKLQAGRRPIVASEDDPLSEIDDEDEIEVEAEFGDEEGEEDEGEEVEAECDDEEEEGEDATMAMAKVLASMVRTPRTTKTRR